MVLSRTKSKESGKDSIQQCEQLKNRWGPREHGKFPQAARLQRVLTKDLQKSIIRIRTYQHTVLSFGDPKSTNPQQRIN